jgi:DNA repair protein RadC
MGCKFPSFSVAQQWTVLQRPTLILLTIQNFQMQNRKANTEWQVAELQVSYKANHDRKVTIHNSDDAVKVLRQMWDHDLIEVQEQIGALFLNTCNEVIGFRLLNTGTSTMSVIDSRLLVGICAKILASSIILVHNHPSGNKKASNTDKIMTESLRTLLLGIGVRVLDHIILTRKSFTSISKIK